MTNTLHVTPQTIGLAAAGAAALGLSLSEGLLQPLGTIERLAAERQRAATSPPRSARRAAKRAAHAAGQIPAAAAPTPEQAEELRRQVGKYLTGPSTPKPHEIQVEGYDPSFRPDPENFGTL